MQRQNRPEAVSRSLFSLAITLAIAACALIAPGAAQAGITTQVLCPGAVTLSGGPASTDNVSVDDDLDLRLNDVSIFLDQDGYAQDLNPIGFAAEFGDQLRVIASNGWFAGHEFIDPLYLTCDANDEQQILDDTGFEAPDGPSGEVFYDETFSIELGPPQTTITKHPKRRAERRRSTFKFVAVPGSGAAFECRLDSKPYKPCESPYTRRVRPGPRHKFRVRATVEGVQEPTPATFSWRVTT